LQMATGQRCDLKAKPCGKGHSAACGDEQDFPSAQDGLDLLKPKEIKMKPTFAMKVLVAALALAVLAVSSPPAHAKSGHGILTLWPFPIGSGHPGKRLPWPFPVGSHPVTVAITDTLTDANADTHTHANADTHTHANTDTLTNAKPVARPSPNRLTNAKPVAVARSITLTNAKPVADAACISAGTKGPQ
jgi:hypothetical protein